MKIKFRLTYLFLLICSFSFGQLQNYKFKRELLGVQDQWHKIILPNEIFGKSSYDLSDLRIFGFTNGNDTIEAPYILKVAKEEIINKDVVFKLINQSKNQEGYFYTFEVPDENPVNQIQLNFKQLNFDWTVNLEGSQNQQEWFSIIQDYRILSIKNGLADFQFSKLAFPPSKYRYFRLMVKSEKEPELLTAKMSLNKIVEGKFRKYRIHTTKIYQRETEKQTVILIELDSFVPLSKLNIFVNSTFDYYRPITIKYLVDSFKTQQGSKYNYSTISTGTLNSLEKNEFKFTTSTLKKLEVIIDNGDNQPLKIDSLIVEGYVHELITRFINPANYYLVYGNTRVSKPHYDIDIFADKIPSELSTLTLGDEQIIEQGAIVKKQPLFQNKIWLWITIVFIIVLLGGFSLSMIKRN